MPLTLTRFPCCCVQDGKAATPPAKGKGISGLPQLQLGPYTVEPAEGTVAPGAKVEIGVIFKAEGARAYRWVLVA